MMEMRVRNLLAANIKAGRQRNGYTQERLAELTELSTQTISDIEGCRTWVSDKTLSKLSEILEVDEFQLLLPMDEEGDNTELRLQQRIRKLRQSLKDDIDKHLDEFSRGKDPK